MKIRCRRGEMSTNRQMKFLNLSVNIPQKKFYGYLCDIKAASFLLVLLAFAVRHVDRLV